MSPRTTPYIIHNTSLKYWHKNNNYKKKTSEELAYSKLVNEKSP